MHSENNDVLILMASYNGENYIAEQLESIILQTHTHWKLIIRDDCSADKTTDIVRAFVAKDNRIQLICGEYNVGSVRNFSLLLDEVANEPYVMFADQDDYWKKEKIERSILKIKEKENRSGEPHTPILIYTNLEYVDGNLIPLKKYIRFALPTDLALKQLMLQNWIYGCTMLFNRALLPFIKSIPPEMENHDYWVALVASSVGIILHEDSTTVLYRQHGNNISGQYNHDSVNMRFRRIFIKHKTQIALYSAKYTMLFVLYQRLYEKLPLANKKLLSGFLDAIKSNGFKRLGFAISNQIKCPGAPQTLLAYFYLLVTPFKNQK